MWRQYNPNPYGARAGDCAVRAICKATGKTWEDVYMDLCLMGLRFGDFGSANSVWGAYLRENGYERVAIPSDDPDCTVERFAAEHPNGTFILALSGHVVTLQDGCWHDTWDSGQCPVIYYWIKKED